MTMGARWIFAGSGTSKSGQQLREAVARAVFEQAKKDAVVQIFLTRDRQIDAGSRDRLCGMVRGIGNLVSEFLVHVCTNGIAGRNLSMIASQICKKGKTRR